MRVVHRCVATLLVCAAAVAPCIAAEGFGMFKKVVVMERDGPPQMIFPIKQYTLVFNDETGRAAALRQRIESDIRAGDPQMRMTSDAPFMLTVRVREFLAGNTHSIDGTFRISDRADRTLHDGNLSASNAGALVKSTDDELIARAAGDVVRFMAPIRYQSATVVPKGRFESLIPLAERGQWPAYLAAVERTTPLSGERDAYREYALAIGHEGTAHQSSDLESKVRHLREAIAHNIAAARMKPSEKLFSEQYMPLSRAFDTPGSAPKYWVDPRTMLLWESMLLVQKWMSAAAPPAGTIDNRSILQLMSAGRDDDAIIGEIVRAEQVRFSLSQSDMSALLKAGVPWRIIDQMRSKAGLPRREFWITPDHW